MYNYSSKKSNELDDQEINLIKNREKRLVKLFGPASYDLNSLSMGKTSFRIKKYLRFIFQPMTTKESIQFVSTDPEVFVRDILEPSWLQIGRVIRTSKGVYANPPIALEGEVVDDEKILEGYLKNTEKVNGIYLARNENKIGLRDFGFAPYDSFKIGFQSYVEFRRGGLARLLSHSSALKANNLARLLGRDSNYSKVDLRGFEEKLIERPLSKILVLGSLADKEKTLVVDGNGSDSDLGYALGVSIRSDLKKNK